MTTSIPFSHEVAKFILAEMKKPKLDIKKINGKSCICLETYDASIKLIHTRRDVTGISVDKKANIFCITIDTADKNNYKYTVMIFIEIQNNVTIFKSRKYGDKHKNYIAELRLTYQQVDEMIKNFISKINLN